MIVHRFCHSIQERLRTQEFEWSDGSEATGNTVYKPVSHCLAVVAVLFFLPKLHSINLNVTIRDTLQKTTWLVQMVGHHVRWPLVLLHMPLEWVLSTIPWTHLHGLLFPDNLMCRVIFKDVTSHSIEKQAVAMQTCISLHISHVVCMRNYTIVYHGVHYIHAQLVFSIRNAAILHVPVLRIQNLDISGTCSAGRCNH